MENIDEMSMPINLLYYKKNNKEIHELKIKNHEDVVDQVILGTRWARAIMDNNA